jgi:hypothetical protein
LSFSQPRLEHGLTRIEQDVPPILRVGLHRLRVQQDPQLRYRRERTQRLAVEHRVREPHANLDAAR